jgi:hypothetical protein
MSSDDQICGIGLTVWWLICAAVLYLVLLLVFTFQAQAVELSIVGNSTGQGSHVLIFSGEQLYVSLEQGLNSSSWQVLAGGRA